MSSLFSDQIDRLKMVVIISLCLIFFVSSLLIGDIHFSIKEAVFTFFGKGTPLQDFIFLHLRLPHTLNAFVIGCLLALSGYLMQIMLGNPLADPYTLGTSGGASVFSIIGVMLGFEGSILIGCSFLGSLVSLLLLSIAAGNLKKASPSKLLLMGVIMAAGWSALSSLLLLIIAPTQTKSILFWLFGNIDSQQYPFFSLSCLVVGILCSLIMKKELHVVGQGTILAKTLGVDTSRLQIKLILLSSLLTAAAVSLGGMIGFIGLMVPHFARLYLRAHYTLLLPCTVFLGGCLLLLADIFARTLIAPEQLPIGILTTLIGIPFFLYLSRNRNA